MRHIDDIEGKWSKSVRKSQEIGRKVSSKRIAAPHTLGGTMSQRNSKARPQPRYAPDMDMNDFARLPNGISFEGYNLVKDSAQELGQANWENKLSTMHNQFNKTNLADGSQKRIDRIASPRKTIMLQPQ